MKKTLLAIVQDILSDTDSDEVNSLSDSVEALQVARIVEQCFYDFIYTRPVPEHKSLIKLTPLADSSFPTHFEIQDQQAKIETIWYDVSEDNSYSYRKLTWLSPEDFLEKIDRRQDDYDLIDDKFAGTKLRIVNNRQPTFYTSFDDTHIVMDSYKSTVDDTLQENKTRAMGYTHPTFSISDSYIPDLDVEMFPMLVREATSRTISLFKGQPDPKVEQAARRNKVYSQNDRLKVGFKDKKRRYGRR
jgi:hypothetical protein